MLLAKSPELFYLALTATLTALIWVPYILNRMLETGLWRTFQGPSLNDAPKAAWACRTIAAHRNAVENLAVFTPLAIIVNVMGLSTPVTTMAAMVFFIARAVHLAVFMFGIPVIRTLAFVTGFACQMALALRIFGLM